MKNKVTMSRRAFIKGVPMGLFGIIAIGTLGGKILSSVSRRQPPKFKEGSIFSPKEEKERT